MFTRPCAIRPRAYFSSLAVGNFLQCLHNTNCTAATPISLSFFTTQDLLTFPPECSSTSTITSCFLSSNSLFYFRTHLKCHCFREGFLFPFQSPPISFCCVPMGLSQWRLVFINSGISLCNFSDAFCSFVLFVLSDSSKLSL